MITNTNQRHEYVGTGAQTIFAYQFLVSDKTHIQVYVNGSLKVVDTDYTVGSVGTEAGGNITFTTAPAADAEIILLGNVEFTQATDYVNSGNFPASSHEAALDKLTRIALQLKETLTRAPLLSIPDSYGLPDLALPTPTALSLLGWDSAGENLANYAISGSGLVLNDDIIGVYTTAGLPAAGTAGKIAVVTDVSPGLYYDTGAAWVQIGFKNVNVALNADGTLKSSQILAATVNGIYVTYSAGVFTVHGATRGHLHGLTLSTAGSSATMSIAAGICTDSTHVLPIYLSASISKTTSAWAVGSGNGGLDTGAIANSTWYHFYAIYRSDTGVADVLCSLSATAPTMPANYSYKRRIGAGKTNGSAQWTAFVQDGDFFQWAIPVNDAAVVNPGTSAVTIGLTVASGINAIWVGAAGLVNTNATETALLVTDLATTDTAPTTTLHHVVVGNIAGNQRASSYAQVRCNTTGQLRYRISASSASTTVFLNTIGWLDRLGRD